MENFARGQIEAQQIEVSADSHLINKPLKRIQFEPHVRIRYTQKGDNLEVTMADTMIKPGNLVTLVGPSNILYTSRDQFKFRGHKVYYRVTLIAASETAIVLVKLLSSPRFKVRIIEKDLKLCEEAII